MKVFFREIRHHDIDACRRRLDGDPGLVAARATAPPKKDDGQSPLQVALKVAAFDIAHLLIDRGADLNYHDTSTINRWTMPVVQDAITASVMSSRWLARASFDSAAPTWKVRNTVELSDAAFNVLERIVRAGADVTSTDSFGNSGLMRASLDARQILPSHHHQDPDWVDPKPLNEELVADLSRIFDLLLDNRARPVEIPDGETQSMRDLFAGEPVMQFLTT